MRTIITSCFVLFAMCCFAAEKSEAKSEKSSELSLDWYGFIRSELFVDSYKGLNAVNDQFYLFPLYNGKDSNGKAINEQTGSNLMPIATRLGLKIAGPEIFNAKTSGRIEFDFGGKPNYSVFRIRHAYFALDWDKSQLIVGQTWHPFWGGAIFPTVGSLNTGAPFQPFNRSPQVRYNYKMKELTLSATAAYELQYKSKGPAGTSDQYARNAAIPEMILSAEYKKGSFTTGAGVSYKMIKPLMSTTGTNGTYITDETLNSTSFNGYAQFKKNKFCIKAKGIYGENMSHLLMLSGYGVKSHDAITGAQTYTAYQHATGTLNMVYGKKWQGGLFLGYTENLGTNDPLQYFNKLDDAGNIINDTQGNPLKVAKTYGLGQSIQKLYRIAPHVALNVSKIRLVAEYEMTAADYGHTGTMDLADGLFSDTDNATNNRFVLMVMYLF